MKKKSENTAAPLSQFSGNMQGQKLSIWKPMGLKCSQVSRVLCFSSWFPTGEHSTASIKRNRRNLLLKLSVFSSASFSSAIDQLTPLKTAFNEVNQERIDKRHYSASHYNYGVMFLPNSHINCPVSHCDLCSYTLLDGDKH